MTSHAARTRTVTEYHQDFPMTGKVRAVTVTATDDDGDDSNDAVLSSTRFSSPNMAPLEVHAPRKIYCPFNATSTQLNYDLSSGHVTTQKVVRTGYDLTDCVASLSKTVTYDYNGSHSIADVHANAALQAARTTTDLSSASAAARSTHIATHTTAREATQENDHFAGLRTTTESVSAEMFYGQAPQPTRGTTTTYEYPAGSPRLHPDSVTTASVADASLTLKRALTYDSYGNVNRTTLSWTGMPPQAARWEETVYTATDPDSSFTDNGYFPHKTYNSQWGTGVAVTTLNHYHRRYGLPGTVTDANGIVTTTTYNQLGLPTKVSVSKGNRKPAPDVYTEYRWQTPTASNGYARFKVRTLQAGTPQQASYSDTLGRVVETRTQTPDGTGQVSATTQHDARGNVIRTTGAEDAVTEYLNHDVLGRPGQRIVNQSPQYYTATYTYNGLTTDITVNGAGKTLTMSRTHNSRGQLLSTTDAKNGVTTYTYDGMGNPTRIQDVLGNTIDALYNDFGHKTQVDDPNQGQTRFTYNAPGELLTQTDANGLVTVLERDNLGRVTRKTQDEDVSTWHFDPVSDNGTPGNPSDDIPLYGVLSSESRVAGGLTQTRTFGYDSLMRLTVQTDDLGPTNIYTQRWQYDTHYGRLLGHQSASGLVTAHQYNDLGYKTVDYVPGPNGEYPAGSTGKILATFDAREVTGQIKQQTLSTSLTQTRDWFVASGQLNTVSAGSLQHLDYGYDGFGNQVSLDNHIDNIRKDYTYDALHRLNTATVTIDQYAPGTINYGYNAAGNITQKTDYATGYEYGNATRTAGGNAGPNALRQITRDINGVNTVIDYEYDLAGNLTDDSLGLKITYDGNHHTKTVERNGALLTFWYDAGGQRFKQTKAINDVTTTTYYVGNVEFVSDGSGDSSRDYIGDHSIVTQTLSGQVDSPLLSYTLRDRFGSVSVVVNADVSLTTAMERRDYDAFGKPISLPRNPDMLIHFVVTNRGFTDHEHLTKVELIHMNGRAYDYNTGRFLSVDPFIQSPTNSQSVNPYSYIMNNPLSGIDPTGYRKEPVDDGGDVPDNNDGTEATSETQYKCNGGIGARRSCGVVTTTNNGNGTTTISVKGGGSITFTNGGGNSEGNDKGASTAPSSVNKPEHESDNSTNDAVVAVTKPQHTKKPAPINGNQQPSANTPTHGQTQQRIANEASKVKTVTSIHMHQRLTTALPKNPGATGQLPDVTVIHNNGKVDLVEVTSKGQTAASQQTKVQQMRTAIGVQGRNIVVQPDPPANSGQKVTPVYKTSRPMPNPNSVFVPLMIIQVLVHEYVNFKESQKCSSSENCV